jgi:pilus assembly protein CpaF
MSAPELAFTPIVPPTVADLRPVDRALPRPSSAGARGSDRNAERADFRPPRRVPGAALLPALVRAAPSAAAPAASMPSVGALAPLLADPSVTDVLVNGAEVWIDRGEGLARCDVAVGSPLDVRRLAQRLAAACGRRLDEAAPYVDACLPDGTRMHAVLAPIATAGPYLSLRTFRHRAFSLDELVSRSTVSQAGAELLASIVSAKLSYLVTGGTGSGKTTLLATLLGLVPRHERIVIVEDAAELRPDHPHVVGLSARTPNVEGAGLVTVRDLTRQALRMRPDRLVIGECRGVEVVDLLGALNTGHEGGTGTLHANTAADVPARLEALALTGITRAALHAQISSALQVIVHMRRTATGRMLEEIAVLKPSGPDSVMAAVTAWHWLGGMRPAAAALAGLLSQRGVRPPAELLGGSR